MGVFCMNMQARAFRKGAAVVLCLLLSLVLHALTVGFLLLLPDRKPAKAPSSPATRSETRFVRLNRSDIRREERKEASAKEKTLPFAKTNPELPEQQPERRDFIGKRNARAASDADAPRSSEEGLLPGMSGEKKEEIVSFDQERQQGELEHDGRRRDNSPQEPLTSPTSPQGQGEEKLPPPDIAESGTEPAPKLRPEQESEPSSATPLAAWPSPPPRTYRDPSLAASSQVGFRTHERRSRHIGRFVLGRGASLNVAATPAGRYQEEIYRRIAYWWYRACDEHRGDIIPGKIIISLRLNSRGRLVNMELIQRSGAGVIQQSFTFGAIRQATLPPMPSAVQEEMVGDILELIFEFVFD